MIEALKDLVLYTYLLCGLAIGLALLVVIVGFTVAIMQGFWEAFQGNKKEENDENNIN